MKAVERYQLTLDQFRAIRQEGKEITLRDFCKEKHVNYPPMTAWLSRKGIFISNLNPIKKKNISKPVIKKEKSPDILSNQIFVPIQPQAPSKSITNGLSGISITFPDGVCVTIKQASACALTDFINNYNLEVV
ncbi:MAG: hypothetical protein ACRCTQ_07140 [Brevinemataceae bacterium]